MYRVIPNLLYDYYYYYYYYYFRLGFYSLSALDDPDQAKGGAVMQPRRIAANYLRLWFWIDAVAMAPWGALHRSLRLVRLLRIFGLLRLRTYFRAWEAQGRASQQPALIRRAQQC